MFLQKGNILLIRILNIIGIKECGRHRSRSKLKFVLSTTLHPFSVFLHLTVLYSFLVLMRSERKFITGQKSKFGSVFNSILSLILWHVVRLRGCQIHSVLKKCNEHLPKTETDDVSGRPKASGVNTVLIMISVCFAIPFVLSTYFAFSKASVLCPYSNTWYFGYKLSAHEYVHRTVIPLLLFAYFMQLTFFPTLFLMIFCFSTTKLANHTKAGKSRMKALGVWQGSVARHSCLQEELLKRIKMHEEVFSFPIFIFLILMTSIGFTGLALEMEVRFEHHVHILEGLTYLYLSAVGIISVAYTATSVAQQLEEISSHYKSVYKLILIGNGTLVTRHDMAKIKILKLIYEQPILRLTAWNIAYLDKNMVLTMFGTLLTYGFLILQLKN